MASSLENLTKVDIAGFQKDLIGWFEEEQRELPWRKDQDPYKVWVSEIMLQQTRVDTVIPYFNRFIDQFPTIEALSSADEDKVLKAWEGLGYYSRVRNLQTAVREVHEKYDGVVPNTLKSISTLKGVGPYTAGAILSIAYGIPEPAVDGNVMRVLSRILSIWEDIAKPATRKVFEEAIREMISHDNPSFFNQALMELGALVCTPTSPSCLLCPVRDHCHAFHEGTQNELPIKTKNKNQRKVQIGAVIIRDEEDHVIIHKRPKEGLLANLWELPNTEIHLPFINEKDQIKSELKQAYNLDIEMGNLLGQLEHVFSHLIWNINIYEAKLTSDFKHANDVKIVTKTELEEFAFPVSYQKIIKHYINE
ncbi:A/G-specific adenine glycosylase [Cytobacillus sp. FJAT-54145]|uniref:Adenine DNA glycosylase n=1 Tax=Cytobacillus spartinae TaxID=3299023 RepID=A0ABW6KA08_9BACI